MSGSGHRQREQFIRDHRDPSSLPHDRFERTGGGKVRCVLCGTTGYGTVAPPADSIAFDGRRTPWHYLMGRWQIGCLHDHPWPCSCGRRFRAYGHLWRHIGAPRPTGWGRQGHHEPALSCPFPMEMHS